MLMFCVFLESENIILGMTGSCQTRDTGVLDHHGWSAEKIDGVFASWVAVLFNHLLVDVANTVAPVLKKEETD